MGGERLDAADVGDLGIDGDRQWAVIDLATGYGLTAKREPELLYASASVADGQVLVHLDAGVTLTGTGSATDAVLSDWLGRPVSLRRATRDESATYEIAADFEAEHDSPLLHWQGPEGTFHDSARRRITIATRAEMR